MCGNKLIQKTIVAAFCAVAACFLFPNHIFALSGSDFRAGNIISDSVFFNGSTMTLGEVQAFLNAKVPSCDTWGTQPSGRQGYPTRADWGRANGAAPPYTCLRDYRQNTPNRPAEPGLCMGYRATPNQLASEIIYYVAESCGINPKALIVLLQKEQSLITDDWPWPIQYRSATGYGCPDTAPCDAEYYGFFNQVYAAARQFKRYTQGGFNHRAGMNNSVRYHPNVACGSSIVYIENQATAGLYNYTPYQPNKAALDNLYGTGDNCSSYGNRNFWRLFNDWFGSTQGGSYLLRTIDNATVYLVVNDTKYPISDINVLDAFSPLGPVGYVSPQYLASKSTGSVLKRLVRSEDGTVYFVDSGIKLPFTSCANIEHYGYTCGDSINLTSSQLALLHTGPLMTRVYGTTSGKKFFIESGKKREVYDLQSLQLQGIGTTYNVLKESGLNHLTYGTPIIRDNVVVTTRGTNNLALNYEGSLRNLDKSLYSQTVLSSVLPNQSLDIQSVDKLAKAGDFRGFIRNVANTKFYLLVGNGKVELTDPNKWTNNYQVVSDLLLNQFPTVSNGINQGLIKSPSDATVYYVENQKKRPIAAWDDLLRVNANPTISTISNYYISALATGTRLLGPGRLVKLPNDATVYIIDGLNKKIPLTTFSVSQDLNLGTQVSTVGNDVLNAYSSTPFYASIKVACGGKSYFVTRGVAYEVSGAMQSHYQFSYISLDQLTCNNLKTQVKPIDRFIRGSDGTIYYIEDGKKRAFAGFNAYLAYGGNGNNTIQASDYAIGTIPTGQLIY